MERNSSTMFKEARALCFQAKIRRPKRGFVQRSGLRFMIDSYPFLDSLIHSLVLPASCEFRRLTIPKGFDINPWTPWTQPKPWTLGFSQSLGPNPRKSNSCTDAAGFMPTVFFPTPTKKKNKQSSRRCSTRKQSNAVSQTRD